MVIFLYFIMYKECTSWFDETLSLLYNSIIFWIESFPNNVVVKFSFCRHFFKGKLWNNVPQFWWIFSISQFFFIFLVLFSLLSLINHKEDWKKENFFTFMKNSNWQQISRFQFQYYHPSTQLLQDVYRT